MFSKLALSLILASLLTTMVASNSNSNFGKNMLPMQTANAVENITPVNNLLVDCEQFDAGTATFDCTLNVKRNFDPGTQTRGDTSNL